MFVHALPGAASFAACLRLFRSYPLAVNHHFSDGAELSKASTSVQGQRSEGSATPGYSGGTAANSGGWQRSIVLRHRGFEGSGFYVLTQDSGEHFTLRPWHRGEGERQEISLGAPVPVTSHRVITEGMPLPRDGALLGWVSDRQVTVLLSVYHGNARSLVGGPQVRVLAMVGSEPVRWPPFTARPLDDGRLWEYVERGEIVDLGPLIACNAGGASWVPSQNPGRAGQGHGCAVISRNLQTEEYWVPAGIYMDHWMLREGVPAPPATHLLTLPGTTDLSRRLARKDLACSARFVA